MLMFAAFAALAGLAVMLLWNAILPEVLGVKELSYWQALGLLALCRLLFGGFGGGPRKPPFASRRFNEKWMNLSEEEKVKMKEEWRKKYSC